MTSALSTGACAFCTSAFSRFSIDCDWSKAKPKSSRAQPRAVCFQSPASHSSTVIATTATTAQVGVWLNAKSEKSAPRPISATQVSFQRPVASRLLMSGSVNAKSSTLPRANRLEMSVLLMPAASRNSGRM